MRRASACLFLLLGLVLFAGLVRAAGARSSRRSPVGWSTTPAF